MRFPTTRWNILKTIKTGDRRSKDQALNEFALIYGAPLYAFARRQTHGTRGPEDCQDFVAGFFLKCVEEDVLTHVDGKIGQFRNFLAASFKNHILNVQRAERAQKRSPEGEVMSIEQLTGDYGSALEPRDSETPEDAFLRVLRASTLKRALVEFRNRCQRAGQTPKYKMFVARDIAPEGWGAPEPSYEELAARFDVVSANLANKIVLAARREFKQLLLAEVNGDCASEREAEVECALVLHANIEPEAEGAVSPVLAKRR